MELIAEGFGSETNLGDYEYLLNEFDEGEVVFYVSQLLDQYQIDQMQADILAQGVILTGPIRQDAGMIVVPFRKELAPLIIIAAIAIPLIGGLLGFQIFKASSVGIPIWVWGVGAIGLLIMFMGSDTGKQAMSIGKMYVTKGDVKMKKKGLFAIIPILAVVGAVIYFAKKSSAAAVLNYKVRYVNHLWEVVTEEDYWSIYNTTPESVYDYEMAELPVGTIGTW